MEMFMSGAAIGMMRTIIRAVRALIHEGQTRSRSVLCAAALGSMILGNAALRIGIGTRQATGTTTSGFG